MSMHIGPRALDPMRGFDPKWAPGPPVGGGGGGIGKGRIALVVAVLAFMWATFFGAAAIPSVSADTFAGNSSPGCTTQQHVLAEFPVQGFASASIQFRVYLDNGGTVTGRWEHSSGQLGSQKSWTAGLDGSGEWWVPAEWIGFSGGTTGTVRYVLQKTAQYGDCFTVTHVQVQRFPVLSTTPVPAASTNAPVLTASATAGPSDPPDPGCDYDTDPECEAPAGWCWAVAGGHPTDPDYELAECEWAPTPPPSPTPAGPDFTMTCSWASPGAQGCSASRAGLAVGAVYRVVFRWQKGGTGGWSNRTHVAAIGSGAVECTQPAFSAASGSYTCVDFTVDNANGVAFQAAGSAVHPASGQHWADWYLVGGTGFATPSPSPTPTPSGQPPQGWPSFPPLPTIAPPNFSWPPYPPFSWPSYPPMPGGSPGAVNICAGASPGAPTPAIAACAAVVPSGSPGPSGVTAGVGEFLPVSSGVLAELDGKVPFAYIGAIQDGLASAAGPGAMPSLCHSFTMGSLGSFEFCIPNEPFALVAEWRWFGVMVVWLAGLVALWRVIESSVGSASADGPTGWKG